MTTALEVAPGALRDLDPATAESYWGWPRRVFDAMRFDGAHGFDAYIATLEHSRQRGTLEPLSCRGLRRMHKDAHMPRYEIASRLGVSRVYYSRVSCDAVLLGKWTARVLAAFWLAEHGYPPTATLPRRATEGTPAERATDALARAHDDKIARAQLAQAVGVSLGTVSKWSRAGVPQSHAFRVLEALEALEANYVQPAVEGLFSSRELLGGPI